MIDTEDMRLRATTEIQNDFVGNYQRMRESVLVAANEIETQAAEIARLTKELSKAVDEGNVALRAQFEQLGDYIRIRDELAAEKKRAYALNEHICRGCTRRICDGCEWQHPQKGE